MQNSDFLVLATDKHIEGVQDSGELGCCRGAVLKIMCNDMPVWSGAAFTQDALSHTQGKCRSVLITWVSQTEKEKKREMLIPANKPPHLLTCIIRQPPSYSTGLPLQSRYSNLTSLMTRSALTWQHLFCHFCPLVCMLQCVSLVFRPFAFIAEWIWVAKEKPFGVL